MSHEEYKEMIAVRAVSALDAAEDRMLTDHLAGCAECRSELDDWQQTLSGLALSAEPQEPSPELRQQILSQIRNSDTVNPAAKVIPFAPPSKNVWSSFGSLGAIAATVLFVALLVFVVILWRENRAIKSQLQGLQAQLQKTNGMVKLGELLAQRGATLTELKNMPVAPGARAKLASDASGHLMVMTDGLPAAPAGKEYQLWYLVGTKPPMRGKTFSTDNQGRGMLEDQMPGEALNSAQFAITLEPKGGSDSPTMPIYLRS